MSDGYKLLNFSETDNADNYNQSYSKKNNNNVYYFKYALYVFVILVTLITLQQLNETTQNKYFNLLNHTPDSRIQAQQITDVISEHRSTDDQTSTHYRQYLTNLRGNSYSNDDLHFPPNDFQLATVNLNSSIWWSHNYRNNSNYITITNYIRAIKTFNHNATITLTTQASTEYMYHALELCKRWDGPISLAVYCPGQELISAITLIKYMRECLPQPLSTCIKDKITWHIVYNVEHGPSISNINFPNQYLAQKTEPLFINQHICPKLPGSNPEESIQQFEEKLRKKIVATTFSGTYRKQHKLVYPINVLRNTARLAAKSKYILASDVELYPSVNLVPQFINYITKHNILKEYSYVKKYVFTLPIFETDLNVTSPRTKSELTKLFKDGKAIFFHKWVCDICQSFPNRQDWFEDETKEEDETQIFEVTQRNRSLNSWEPIYIGTNDDPIYDERLSWEGRRDKMSQAYQLCLENYYLLVLKNAFLVHAPGIKHIDNKEVSGRLYYLRQNNRIYDSIINDFTKLYSSAHTINTC